MAYVQYTDIPENDLSRGIDARSAETSIDPGFVKDLLNGEVLEKRVRKRVGYQGHAGNVPVRVLSAESIQTTNQICFTLDQSIDLGSIRSSPLVVYGKLESSVSTMGSGTFNPSTDVGRYYSTFTTTIRKEMGTGAGTIDVPGTEHALETADLYIGTAEASSSVTRDNTIVGMDNINVDETSFDIAVDYNNGTGSAKDIFVYYLDKSTVAGDSYVATGTGSSVSISSGTHGLSNFNILVRCYIDNGTDRNVITPDSITINNLTGQVDVTFSSSINYIILLSAAPTSNSVTGIISAGVSAQIEIEEADTPFLFASIYEISGTTLTEVLPNSISFNDSTNIHTITMVNSTSSAKSFVIYYEYGQIRSNQICVEDSLVTADISSTRPQLTLWGLDHTEIYPDPTLREGWVSHVDSYRRAGEQRIICGLGGNLFGSYSLDEISTSYLLPQTLPNLTYTVDVAGVIGPLLWDTGETPARRRGYITADAAGEHWAEVSAVAYDSSNTYVKYTIELPNKAILNSSGSATALSSVISTTTDLEDWLTVTDMSYARHNGTFKIKQIQDDTDRIYLWVENTSIDSSDYDDSGVSGQAGVFTDNIDFTTVIDLLPGDTLVSPVFGNSIIASVLSVHIDAAVIDGIVDVISLGSGLQIPAKRTSSVISVASTEDFVRGDMIAYSEVTRLCRIKYINPDTNRNLTINGDGSTATAILSSGNTDSLQVGMDVIISRAGVYSGIQTITEVNSATSFSFSSAETETAVAGVLVGGTLHIDEDLTWQDTTNDSVTITVSRRLIPLEAPEDSWGLTPNTYVRHLDSTSYNNQNFLRSTMVVDNMYFTNYGDEVYKFDGTNIYRAGLFAWQPGLFIVTDTNPTAKIIVNNPSATPSAVADNVFTLALGDEQKFSAGDRVRHSFTGGFNDYTVLKSYDDSTNGFVEVSRTSTTSIALGAAPSLTRLSQLRYYFRLNAVDANDNVIASAVTGAQDHVVELAQDAAIRLRLVGFPAWDVYDYDRLEVEIYRTKSNTSVPFYKITTLEMEFDSDNGYIDFVDSFSDSDLFDLDAVNTALLGEDLGTTWSDPVRAKYTTSIGNRLVLGNVTDYPQLDIQLVADGTLTDSALAGDYLTFRRDNTAAGTVTDMTDTAVYEWVQTSSALSISSLTGSVGVAFTVQTGTNHGLSVGDWVYLFHSAVPTTSEVLLYSGWWQVATVPAADQFTVNFDGTEGSPAGTPDKCLLATDPTNIPVPLGTDGNMGMANGNSSLVAFTSMRRMSMAINTTMRKVDTSISGYEDFIPWLVARGGNDVSVAGRLLVRQPRADSTTVEMIPTFSGYDLFINNIRRSTGDQVSASTRLYPSRILVSYENYPELFDSPTATLDSDSDSAIDVNSADGQEITGVIPFFGEAAFGAAQQAAILIVFKTNSIYLVDINEKIQGRNPVQRIETEGLGCTAPYSIASTKNGIMFANESGIYCLRRNQAIQYIGRYMERNWQESVNRDYLDIVQGHHYGVGRQYKVSVPLADSSTTQVLNSEAYVYDHTGEQEGLLGAWSRFDNHPATGWANLEQDAYMASSTGRVFSIRRATGDEELTNYRDDNQAINFQLQTRANDFGNYGIRKVIDQVTINYRVGAENTGTSVGTALDTEQEYRTTTPFTIPKQTQLTGVGDSIQRDMVSITHNTDRRRGLYFQVQVANSTLDENVEIAGIMYSVGGLTTRGKITAAKTREEA